MNLLYHAFRKIVIKSVPIVDLDHFIWKDVHDSGSPGLRNGIFQIVPIKVCMSVKEVTGLRFSDQKIQRPEALMGEALLIVDSKWGRVCDKDIQLAAITYLAT